MSLYLSLPCAHAMSCRELFLNGSSLSEQAMPTDLNLGSRVVQTAQAIRARLRARFTNETNLQLRLWEQMETGNPKALVTQKILEDTLQSGKIISMKSVGDWGAQFVVFENGIEAVWKSEGKSARIKPNKEVAAYVLDRTLELNLVPITIFRTINGVKGSMQVRITGAKEGGIEIPNFIRLFDFLIANSDRHPSLNWLKAPDGRVVAIDHDNHTFWRYGTTIPSLLMEIQKFYIEIRSLKAKYSNLTDKSEKASLAQAIKGWEISLKHLLQIKKKYEVILQSHPDAIAKLEEISEMEWHQILSPYLDMNQMEGFLTRRQEILTYFNQIRETGEISSGE